MMREFQAETDRHQTLVEKNSNGTADSDNARLISNEPLALPTNVQQIASDHDASPPKINGNTQESRTMADRNRSSLKPVRFISIF